MLNKDTFDSLTLEGKNILKEDNQYQFDHSSSLPNDEICNYILNSNIQSNNSIK